MITLGELRRIMPFARARAELFVDHLNAAMVEFDINNPLREAAFLAQVAHESGELRYLKEIASGEAYEGRKDLGNTEPGDGMRFPGRGLIQTTGRTNTLAVLRALGLAEDHPEALEEPVNACRSAGYFWSTHGLNVLADRGDFLRITKIINGGTTHYQERLAYYERAKHVFASEVSQ